MRQGPTFKSRSTPMAGTWTGPQTPALWLEKLPERLAQSIAGTLRSWSRHPLIAAMVRFAHPRNRPEAPAFLHLDDAHLLAHLDGELSVVARRQVADHLQSCWSCRGRFRELLASINAFILTRESQSPDSLSDVDLRIRELRQRLAQESEIPTLSR